MLGATEDCFWASEDPPGPVTCFPQAGEKGTFQSYHCLPGAGISRYNGTEPAGNP